LHARLRAPAERLKAHWPCCVLIARIGDHLRTRGFGGLVQWAGAPAKSVARMSQLAGLTFQITFWVTFQI
jgi:hypothetical protein